MMGFGPDSGKTRGEPASDVRDSLCLQVCVCGGNKGPTVSGSGGQGGTFLLQDWWEIAPELERVE